MQKLRTIIVDDEPLALDFLRACLSGNADVEIIAECREREDNPPEDFQRRLVIVYTLRAV